MSWTCKHCNWTNDDHRAGCSHCGDLRFQLRPNLADINKVQQEKAVFESVAAMIIIVLCFLIAIFSYGLGKKHGVQEQITITER